MLFERRSVLALSACALAFGQASLARASASEISSLRLVNYAGKRSSVWAILDILRPALQQQLKCEVEIETIDGHAGFDAVESIRMVEPGKPKLFCGAIMGMQYAEKVKQRGALLESLTPIARLMNGYSVTLFAKRGSRFKAWSDLATVAPLRVCAPPRPAPGYLAELMMEHSSGLKTTVTGGMNGVQSNVDDVLSGRCDVGILATRVVAKQLDQLQPIVSFGAARNAALGQTPTFAEVTGNPKLAFTESAGAFASPKIDPAVAALLTKALLAVGEYEDVINRAEAENLPLSIGGPEALAATMKRNEGVLQRILG